MHAERRHWPRHSFDCEVDWQSSAPGEKESARFRGRVVDLSTNGACIIADRRPKPFDVLPWKFYVHDVPVPLQMLGQIRWVEPVNGSENAFRFGLMFLP